jgi:ParB-like chromosome segregation protein Spo0J
MNYFITYYSRGINTTIMKQLADLFMPYNNTIVDKENINVFKDVFDERMSSYYGRAKAPICEYWGLEDNDGGFFHVFVKDGTDTPKSVIQLNFSIVNGTVNSNGEKFQDKERKMTKSFKRDPVLAIIGREDEQVRELPVDEIKTGEPFIGLLPIRDEVYEAILSSIKEHGYDKAQPVILWKERGMLIDGHTRLKAAKEAGIEYIPVINKPFGDEEAALDYVYKLQFARRNIRDGELIILAQKALEKYEKRYGEGGKPEYLAKKFPGLSVAKAKQMISVIANAAKEELDEILEERSTINTLYENLKMARTSHFDKPIENGSDVHDEKLKKVSTSRFQEDENTPNNISKGGSGSIKKPFQEYKTDQAESDAAADERREKIQASKSGKYAGQEAGERAADNTEQGDTEQSELSETDKESGIYLENKTVYDGKANPIFTLSDEFAAALGKHMTVYIHMHGGEMPLLTFPDELGGNVLRAYMDDSGNRSVIKFRLTNR